MNKAFKRYNTRIEIPVTVVLETIFSDDNKDVESLSRWALKHGFVDLVKENENDKLGYYKLQDDYTKQSFYILLDKEERKQYDYENFLCEKLEEKDKEIERLKSTINKAIDRLDISGDIQAEQYEWVLATTINETKNILKEGK